MPHIPPGFGAPDCRVLTFKFEVLNKFLLTLFLLLKTKGKVYVKNDVWFSFYAKNLFSLIVRKILKICFMADIQLVKLLP